MYVQSSYGRSVPEVGVGVGVQGGDDSGVGGGDRVQGDSEVGGGGVNSNFRLHRPISGKVSSTASKCQLYLSENCYIPAKPKAHAG